MSLSYTFGEFRLDTSEKQLLNGHGPVNLTPKAYEVLLVLVDKPGRLLLKEDLIRQVWPDAFVEESNLAQHITQIRKGLGDSASDPKFIETVPKRGYRFIAEVQALPANPPPHLEPPAPKPTHRRHLLVAGIATAFAASAAALWLRPAPAPSDPGTILVLPFTSVGPAPTAEYIADALTDEVVSALAAAPNLRVLARATTFQLKGKSVNIRDLGKQLNAGSVLEGAIRQESGKLHITLRLDSTREGTQIWSAAWDRNHDDVFVLPQDIARAIADAVQAGDRRPVKPSTTSVKAYNLYLRGLHHRNRVYGDSLDKAAEYFREAIKEDPSFAAAHAALAYGNVVRGYTGQGSQPEAFAAARAEALNALRLDPGLAEAHACLGMVHFLRDWDWDAATKELDIALAADPFSSIALHWRSHLMTAFGQPARSLRDSLKAIEVDPLNPDNLSHLAWHYDVNAQYDLAERACIRSSEVDPNHVPTKYFLSTALAGLGRYAEAVDARPGLSQDQVAAVKRAIGTQGAAAYWEFRLRLSREEQNPSPFGLAITYINLGRKSDALDSLERSLKTRNPWTVYTAVEPAFKTLRGEPRYEAILRQLRLPRPAAPVAGFEIPRPSKPL